LFLVVLPWSLDFLGLCRVPGWPVAVTELGAAAIINSIKRRKTPGRRSPVIPFEQKEPDYLLWGCFRSSSALAGLGNNPVQVFAT
jgi:hypothetical protein